MTDAPREDVINHSTADQIDAAAYPDWLKQRLQWFEDLKFGLFMHWGPYCQWGCIESWPLVEEDAWARPDDLTPWVERNRDLATFRRDYWKLNETFNPRQFEPERWAELAQRAGMKYMAFTTKHHDGFCMFDTATTDYKITHPSCPFHDHPRANVTREIFDAFRARDFASVCYFSKSDWHCPWYWDKSRPYPDRNVNYDTHDEPELWARFVRFVQAQVEELMRDYGRMDLLWLDGGQVRPPQQDIDMDRMVAMAREYQPGLIVADRTVGGQHENILTPEQTIPAEPLGHTWESCITLGNGWSYRPNDNYKPARELVHMLLDVVCKGGNLLLNIGPSPEGRFDPEAERRLEELAAWMDLNAAGIHGSRAMAPYRRGDVAYTQKGDDVYAFVLAPEPGQTISETVALEGVRPAAGSDVVAVGSGEALSWTPTDTGASVNFPESARRGEHAWALRLRV